MTSPRAFDEEFPELLRVAYRAAYRITGEPTAAEDAASEALVKASLRWGRISERAGPWVVRVASNLAVDHLRRTARRNRFTRDRSDLSPDEHRCTIDLHRALKTLSKRQREVVVLRYFGDLSEAEIAAELGLAPGTVKSHASRGLAALRLLLEDRPVPSALQPEAR